MKTNKMIGGIYKQGENDYFLSDGFNLYYLFDGISDIKEDVEIDGSGKLVEGYSLSIDKVKKLWKIKDTGHKGCKHILQEGEYTGLFYESLKPILKIFSK